MTDPVHHALADAVSRATGASGAWLVGVTAAGFEVLAAVPQGSLGGSALPRTSGLIDLVAAGGQAMSVSATSTPVESGLEPLLGARPESLLCVPCADDGEVLGLLVALNKQTAAAFSIDDVEMVELLAGIAAVVLGRDRAGSGR